MGQREISAELAVQQQVSSKGIDAAEQNQDFLESKDSLSWPWRVFKRNMPKDTPQTPEEIHSRYRTSPLKQA